MKSPTTPCAVWSCGRTRTISDLQARDKVGYGSVLAKRDEFGGTADWAGTDGSGQGQEDRAGREYKQEQSVSLANVD
jgi:hypothetical protein